MFKPTWLMIKQHNVTGLKYFCKTVKTDPHTYKGSGVRWCNHLKKHGRDVSTIWYKLFDDSQELTEYAIRFSVQNNIVESPEWANLVIEDGITGWPPGTKHKTTSIDKCKLNANGFKKGCTPHNSGKKNSDNHYKKQIEGMKKFRETDPDKYKKTLDNLKPTVKRETNRKKAIKEKLSGKNNHKYDPIVYGFKHKITLEEVKLTRNDFYKKYNLAPQNVYKLIKGARKSVNGWQLVII